MPIHNIPLAQTANARAWGKSIGASAKDAQVINGFYEVSTNPAMGTKTVSVQKRSGSSTTGIDFSSPSVALKYYGAARISSPISAMFLADNGDVFSAGEEDYGNIGSGSHLRLVNNYVCDAIIGGQGVAAFVESSADGWYLWDDAASTNTSFSASLTSGQATIVGLANSTGIYDGQLVSGSGVPASTRVSDVLSSSMVLLSQAVTQSGTKTITKEPIAKILDSDFPTDANSMDFLGTRWFVGTNGGDIYQSAVNDPSSYSSSDITNADYSGDGINFIFKWGNYIVAAGLGGTIQYFEDVGNSTGSVLSAAKHLNVIGITMHSRPVIVGGVGYFLGKSTYYGQTYGLYALTGINTITPMDQFWSEVISTLALTRIGTATISAREFVVFCSSSSATQVYYDPATNMFGYLDGFVMTSSFETAFTKASTNPVFHWEQGNTWTDSGSAYTLTIQTEPQDPAQGISTRDVWADLLADTEASGTATLSISDNDYQSWVTKGTFDMTKNKKRVNALGFHDGPRAYRLQHSDNTNFRGQVLRVNFMPSEK